MAEDHPHPPPLPPQVPPVPVASLSYLPPAVSSYDPAVRSRNIRQFFIGLIAGTVVSVIFWILGWNALDRYSAGGIAIIAVPIVKLIVGVTLVCLRGRRSLGAGILVSIALGFLIFFGVCTVTIIKEMNKH